MSKHVDDDNSPDDVAQDPEVNNFGYDIPPADYADALDVVQSLSPYEPVHLLRPVMIHGRVKEFIDGFEGETAYAVRANYDPRVIGQVHAAGIKWYSCDTLHEIERVRAITPDARFLFAHPVKPIEAIDVAYKKYRVRAFVVDHPSEIEKIQMVTAADCTLVIRLNGPAGALQGEGYRYGCDVEQAVWMAKEIVRRGYKLGLSFQLGSQVMDPAMYEEGVLVMREVMYRARFMLDMVCIGGGFPAIYDRLWPAPRADYFKAIHRALHRLHLPRTCQVLCTPGRALVADSVSILCRVEQRRGQMLYINDGLMGGLSSINISWWKPPLRVVRSTGEEVARHYDKFLLSGPACYGNDTMSGPFYLPEDVKAGDYIEFGQMGAYGASMATVFQQAEGGALLYTVADDPPMPLGEGEMFPNQDELDNIDDDLFGEDPNDEAPFARGAHDDVNSDAAINDFEDYDDKPKKRR